MIDAAPIGDLFCTLTGDIHVIRKEHFEKMKDGAIVANSGHFNVEIDIPALEEMAIEKHSQVRKYVDEYVLPGNRRIFLLAEGRLINLAAAEGHPASVMDMSFATQSLTTEYAIQNNHEVMVHKVPEDIEKYIATLKLKTMGITIDELTDEQKEYLASWEMGT
jgi:adenosylhomocysteinase